jgi:hypothetical protein
MNAELKEVESRYWEAMKNLDPRAASALTDEECIIVGAQGVGAVTPEAIGQMLEKASWTIDGYAMDEANTRIRMIDDHIAIVAYPVHEDLHVDGKKVSLDAFDATVWIKKDGKWVSVLHTESIAGDPFGRDRAKGKAAARDKTPRASG